MADYYLTSAFEITKLTDKEKRWLEEHFNDASSIAMDDEFESKLGLFSSDDGSLRKCILDYGGWGWDHSFQYEPRTRETPQDESTLTMFVEAEEYGNTDALAAVLHSFMQKFRPGDPLVITWAFTCSKGRPGAFGGGGVLIFGEHVEFLDAESALREKHLELTKAQEEKAP